MAFNVWMRRKLKYEIGDEILLNKWKSAMEDVKDEGNAAGDANTKNEEKDDNIL